MNDKLKDRWLSMSRQEYTAEVACGKQLVVQATDIAAVFGEQWTLDMSCGPFARNAAVLRKQFGGKLAGYDLPNVVGFAESSTRKQYDLLTSDFEEVCALRPRVVVAIVALQHFSHEQITWHCSKLAAFPHLLYVQSRTYCDVTGTWVHEELAPFYHIPQAVKYFCNSTARTSHWSAILVPK